MRVLVLACLSLASVSAQTCSGSNSHYCGTSGGSADQPAIPAESGCCCNWGFEVISGTANCQKATTTAAAVCGAFSYQCGSGDEREHSGCTGCCCNFGYTAGSDCDCVLASASPAPSGVNTCSSNSYQCSTGDERAHPDCDGCCCLYGFEPTSSTCECAAASKSPAPSGVSTCSTNSYQCGTGDDREHPDCGGCCCLYGFEPTSSTCECAAASKSPAPSGNAGQCSTNTYQCGTGDDREHPDCGGCCCLYGFEPTSSTCECAAASKSPAPSGIAGQCSTNTYQCGSGDDREHPDCGGCCCFFGTSPTSSTCECTFPSPTPSQSVGAVVAGQCSTNSYQCGSGDDREHPDCGGCCCNFNYNPVSGSCMCEPPSPTASPSAGAAAAGQCGNNAYICSAEDSNAHSSCSGCCCNYGFTEVGGTCGCEAASKSPSPAAPLTCGSNAYQCSASDSNAHSSCSGCCCNFGHTEESGTCNCIAPSPAPASDPTSASCGQRAFICGGVGSSNQPALTGANCDQCCCFWGATQVSGTCDCQY